MNVVLWHGTAQPSSCVYLCASQAYEWLRTNTPEDAKIMSWWDYGYQLAAMANRTVLIDNNTWNTTHIATVGRALASTEEQAVPILRRLDVDYVMVTFGGLTGFSSDDVNKFLWMLRITGAEYPSIREADYLTASGQFHVNKRAPRAMLNSLLYKLVYHRFSDVKTEAEQPLGFDRVRREVIGNKGFGLEHFTEVLTTEHWLVRIYKLNRAPNRVPLPTQ